MKTLLQICVLALVLQGTNLFGQCNTPMANHLFNSSRNSVASANSPSARLNAARNIIRTNCLTSMQAKEIMLLLGNDDDRIVFGSEVFNRLTDKQNFYELYDGFSYFSNVFRLHDQLTAMRGGTGGGTGGWGGGTGGGTGGWGGGTGGRADRMPTYDDNYTGFTFPSSVNYRGTKGANCNIPRADADFEVMRRGLRSVQKDQLLNRAKNLSDNNCLTTTHVMKLALMLEFESDRLEYLKHAYPKTFDLANFSQAQQVLNHSYYKEDLINFIGGINNGTGSNWNNGSNNNACAVSDAEMATMKKSISDKTFANAMESHARTIIATRCFTTNQIKEFMNLFAHESNKLNIAKYAYDFTIDTQNYYILTDVLTFSSSKTELSNYIKSKQ